MSEVVTTESVAMTTPYLTEFTSERGAEASTLDNSNKTSLTRNETTTTNHTHDNTTSTSNITTSNGNSAANNLQSDNGSFTFTVLRPTDHFNHVFVTSDRKRLTFEKRQGFRFNERSGFFPHLV